MADDVDAILSGVRLYAFGPGQSSGRSARLHKALVERKLATELVPGLGQQLTRRVFALDVTVGRAFRSTGQKSADGEIEKIRTTPPSRHELERRWQQIKHSTRML